MVEQGEEEGQVAGVDALFVQRQDEAAGGGVDEVVAVLDPFRDALGGDEVADIVIAAQEGGQRFCGHLCVDGHAVLFPGC